MYRNRIEAIWSAEDGEIFDNVYLETDLFDQEAVSKVLQFIKAKGRTDAAEPYINALSSCDEKTIKKAIMCQKKNHQTILTAIGLVLAAVGVITIASIGIVFIIAAIVVLAIKGGNKKAWNLLTLNGRYIHPVLLGHEQKREAPIDTVARDVTDSGKGQHTKESTNGDCKTDIDDSIIQTDEKALNNAPENEVVDKQPGTLYMTDQKKYHIQQDKQKVEQERVVKEREELKRQEQEKARKEAEESEAKRKAEEEKQKKKQQDIQERTYKGMTATFLPMQKAMSSLRNRS